MIPHVRTHTKRRKTRLAFVVSALRVYVAFSDTDSCVDGSGDWPALSEEEGEEGEEDALYRNTCPCDEEHSSVLSAQLRSTQGSDCRMRCTTCKGREAVMRRVDRQPVEETGETMKQ